MISRLSEPLDFPNHDLHRFWTLSSLLVASSASSSVALVAIRTTSCHSLSETLSSIPLSSQSASWSLGSASHLASSSRLSSLPDFKCPSRHLIGFVISSLWLVPVQPTVSSCENFKSTTPYGFVISRLSEPLDIPHHELLHFRVLSFLPVTSSASSSEYPG